MPAQLKDMAATVCLVCAGETANGNWPDKAVETMAAIVANAEVS